MLQTAIKQALVTHVQVPFETAFPAVAVAWPNAPFDWNNLPELYVEFEIDFMGGMQIGMSAEPRTRLKGFVYATVNVKCGIGTNRATDIVDWFNARLGYARIERITVFEPDPNTPTPAKGWHSEQAKFYFHADP